MALWMVWLIIGCIMLLAEAAQPGVFIFLPLALTCVTIALPAWYGISVTAQFFMAIFTLAGIIYLLRISTQRKQETLDTNMYALIGKTGYVTRGITPYTKGYVSLDGTLWLAASDVTIPNGTLVRVQAVEGCHVKVQPHTKESV